MGIPSNTRDTGGTVARRLSISRDSAWLARVNRGSSNWGGLLGRLCRKACLMGVSTSSSEKLRLASLMKLISSFPTSHCSIVKSVIAEGNCWSVPSSIMFSGTWLTISVNSDGCSGLKRWSVSSGSPRDSSRQYASADSGPNPSGSTLQDAIEESQIGPTGLSLLCLCINANIDVCSEHLLVVCTLFCEKLFVNCCLTNRQRFCSKLGKVGALSYKASSEAMQHRADKGSRDA